MASPELGRYILQFDDDGNVVGDIAARFDVNEDLTAFTIYLREGMRWSDGTPFTADDIVFRFDDLYLFDGFPTRNVYPQVKRVVKIDDYAVRLESDVPNPRIILKMATWQGGNWTAFTPSHYLSQWHIAHNELAEERAKEEGFEFWWEALIDRDGIKGTKYIESPTLHPWALVSLNSHVLERNPFYWRVDAEGNQLPYIDRVVSQVVDQETYTVMITRGEVDIAYTHTTTEDIELLKMNEENGGYRVTLIPDFVTVSIAVNLNHPDPRRAQLYQTENFRKALSMAIDRDHFNDTVYSGRGTPRQSAPISTVSDFDPTWERAYVGYDFDSANRLLDEIGMTVRDSQDFRMLSSDVPLVLVLEYREGTFRNNSLELIKDYWSDIGINVQLREIPTRDFSDISWEAQHNDHDARALLVNGEEIFEFTRGAPYYSCIQSDLPISSWRPCGDTFNWAFEWGRWLAVNSAIASGEKTLSDFDDVMPGTEPPNEIKALDSWTRNWVNTELGSPEYVELARKIYGLQAERLWVIGVVGQAPKPFISSTNIGNVPTIYKPGAGYPVGLAWFGDQLYFKEDG